jgi:glutamate--cysteine ligase catalytic subunit
LDENTDPEVGARVPWDRHHASAVDDLDYRMAQRSPTQFYLYSRPSHGGEHKSPTSPENIVSMSPCQQVVPLDTPSIYMDAMGFGMGCCCLQATFQARDIIEARNLYDQLAVLCPIFLALTAATPIVRGLLAETDVRWNIVSASVDDRTPKEKTIIAKSRYDSISTYIGTTAEAERHSDLNLEIDEKAYKALLDHGIDDILAKHVAHLFIRDPLVIFTDFKEVDDSVDTDHFENIQSTNWQTVRFKPPPAKSTIGWRVEFRVMEVQLTDFENAAFTVFIVLLTRIIISYGLNFYMPLSKVDNNMAKAHKRDAVRTEKFAFRKNIHEQGADCECEEYTINEIINGKGESFIGLAPLMRRYLDGMMDLDVEDRMKLDKYISLVSKRASGELMTAATYLRKRVQEHPSYNKDSIVSEEIAYDLIKMADRISQKKEIPVELLGDLLKQKQ